MDDDPTPKDGHESSSDEKTAQVSHYTKPYPSLPKSTQSNANKGIRKGGMISSADLNVADRIN